MVIPKYRAWIKTEYCFADYIESIRFYSKEIDLCWGGICESDCFNFEDVIFMQSTGMVDEIGYELFEGDIILWTYWDEFEDEGVAKIVFDKGMFKLLDRITGEEVWDSLADCAENCNIYLQGNIYKNP
ncbi:hypothetical protein DW820_05580 [Streptococcus parasanguinis]|uniref:YopX protein domain-containing protein n=1 Tax=Streptococcus parasanguinis TaxID=1318 RepID=A0A414CIH8_STRPA|nr:hypothetical protein DW820_05580 [Streptococcus parasanguinis]